MDEHVQCKLDVWLSCMREGVGNEQIRVVVAHLLGWGAQLRWHWMM